MTLLRQIQEAAADAQSDLPTLLRRTKILAARLQNDQLRQWADKELDGYSEADDLPDYRIVHTISYGDFHGPFQSGVRNAAIPLLCLPEDWREWATTLKLYEGVSSYVEMLKSKDQGNFRFPWHPDYVAIGQQRVKVYERLVLGSAWQTLPRGSIALLLDSVRNRVLSLALEIEQKAPEAGEVLPGDPPSLRPEVVRSIVNNTIFLGDYHNIAVGSQKTLQSITREVRQGDFNSLREVLLNVGLLDADIQSLQDALSEEPPSEGQAGLGPRTKAWLVASSRKLMGAAGDAAMETAFDVLAEAIAAYAGVNLDLSSLGSPF